MKQNSGIGSVITIYSANNSKEIHFNSQLLFQHFGFLILISLSYLCVSILSLRSGPLSVAEQSACKKIARRQVDDAELDLGVHSDQRSSVVGHMCTRTKIGGKELFVLTGL